ncbi:MAG: hypothetical protein OXP73_15565 [Chloroflexota bacterium]|nr:hypothetical protein [Chloroflexota bacterium]
MPELIGDLFHRMHDPHDVHPVIASAVAPIRLVPMHPLVGGHGHTSRLRSMLYLYRACYDFTRLVAVSEYHVRDLTAFDNAIQSVRRTQPDMTQWIAFFTSGLVTQLTERSQKINGRSFSSIATRGGLGTRTHLLPGLMSSSVQRLHHCTVRGPAELPRDQALDASGAIRPILDSTCRLECF